MRVLQFITAVAGTTAISCSAPSTTSRTGETQTLLQMHQTILLAHRNSDVSAWLALESDSFVVGNRGQITFPAKEERRAARGAYLEATRFVRYADLRDPIVAVSDDGTLGWVIAQVEASGVYTGSNSNDEPVEFVSAWIELYRKEDNEWRLVGNLSNFQ